MNKLPFVILIIFFLPSGRESQECDYIKDYYQTVYLAEEAYYKGDFQKVFDSMSAVTENCKLINQLGSYEMLFYAEAAAKIGEDEKAFELIRNLIQNGYELDQLKTNEAFSKVIQSPEWHQIEKDYPQLRTEYLKTINMDLRNQIREMISADQYHRNMLNKEGINRDSIWVIIDNTDSINDIKLKNIIETYGYPNERIIGGYNIDQQHVDPGILLFHFDDYDYYTKTLKGLIKKGETPPHSLGHFVDSYQRRMKDQKKYIYGIYENTGEAEIIEYEKLDERRISIGLPPRDQKNRVDSLRWVHYILKN